MQEYLNELAAYYGDQTNMIAKEQSKQAARRILELMREDQEPCARACVLSGRPA
jgi:hypothetical protein